MNCQPFPRILLLLILIALIGTARGYAATVSAASCSQSDVQAALNSGLHDGDTVAVPAGSCTWTTTVTPPCSSWTLQGQGPGTTTITVNNSGGNGISVSSCSGKSIRITGFTWTRKSTQAEGMFHFTGGTGLSFRIDHNTLNSTGGWGRLMWVNVPCASAGCVVDHNTITNVGIEIAGELSSDASYPGCGGSADNCAGMTQWNQPMALDNGSEIYFEDNTFSFDNYFSNDMMDCMNGGRYVFRHNTVTGQVIFDHGFDSVATSCVELTAYQNTIDGAYNGTNQAQAGVLFRGGTGVIYQNILKNAAQANILVTNYRSNNSGQDDIHDPYCDGSNKVDGNTTNGWPCYQQPGRGTGTSSPGLASYPIYEWDNCQTALGCTGTADQNTISVYNNLGGSVDYTSADIIQNRDFFDSVNSFTGKSGIGIGAMANRPTTCKANVGYWATDTNTLYQCGNSNSWTAYYQPFTYPHPLTGGASAGNGPPPPTGLTAVVM